MAWLAVSAGAGVLAVQHRGEPTAAGILWSTEAVTTGDLVQLAVPIPMEEVGEIRGARAVVRDGMMTGWEGVSFVVLETKQAGRDGLRPPLLLAPGAPQQVTVAGQSFTPDPALGFVRHLGWMGSPEVGERERWTLRKHFGVGVRNLGAAILTVETPMPQGLPGGLLPSGARSGAAIGGVLLASLGVIGALVFAYRRLDRSVKRERLAAWVAEL